MASLLTGDPLLLIGNHGCAKTHVANKVAQALGRKFLVYDASKAMFEDVLATHINGDDSPSLGEWTGGEGAGTVADTDVKGVGEQIRSVLLCAGRNFVRLRSQMDTLSEFLLVYDALKCRREAPFLARPAVRVA